MICLINWLSFYGWLLARLLFHLVIVFVINGFRQSSSHIKCKFLQSQWRNHTRGVFSSSSFLLLMFIFCGATLHGLLWLLALCIKKNVQEFKAFYLKFAKGCLFCKGVRKHFKFLKFRLM